MDQFNDPCFQHVFAITQWVFWSGVTALFLLYLVLLDWNFKAAFLHLIGRSRQSAPLWIKALAFGICLVSVLAFWLSGKSCS